jgi:hypothetical protein
MLKLFIKNKDFFHPSRFVYLESRPSLTMVRLKYRHRQRLRLLVYSFGICTCSCILLFIWLLWPNRYSKNILPVYCMSMDGLDMKLNFENVPADLFLPIRVATDKHEVLLNQIFEAGHDIALVLKDTATLSPLLLLNWEKMLATAPADWSVLQLWTDNPVIREYCEHLKDPWISWFPEHTATDAYFVNRRGLKSLVGNTGELFSRAKTYTSTRFYVKARHLYEIPRSFEKWPVPKKERVLVITTSRILDGKQLEKELERWVADYNAVVADWHLTIVVTDQVMHVKVNARWPMFLERLKMNIVVQAEPYSKFRFVRDSIPHMSSYDHVVIKDSDQNIVGMPWQSFLSEDAVIRSPLRQTMTGPDERQWFKFTDGALWKDTEEFRSFQSKKTPFLEQYFVMMDGAFAAWFFPQILTEALLKDLNGQPTQSNWGPDVLWCGAAREWAPRRTVCLLVPVISRHDDTKQVYHWTSSSLRRYRNLEQASRYKEAFPQWLLDDSADITH